MTYKSLVSFQSGATRLLPARLALRVQGLSAEGRVVVQDEGFPWTFGLTLCCNAYDKGLENRAGCRACYGPDAGEYGAVVVDPKTGAVLAPTDLHPTVSLPAMFEGPRVPTTYKPTEE